MKATPLIINWHDNSSPIYTCNFEPQGKGRLATGGGDTHVRLWQINADGEDRKVEYLSTLSKHTQAVNVVRWAPKGEILASAGDDGNVILWMPAERHQPQTFGLVDSPEDKETWRVKNMTRSIGSEIYDLAWSPDGVYYIVGSMDNVARIYNASTGAQVRQVAEHNHYVQGVAWDPLNEYVATQSSDRSVHIYTLKTKDGQFSLDQSPARVAHHAKFDFPSRRISSHSPAPPDLKLRGQTSMEMAFEPGSPALSAPGTPTSVALPMNPPSVVSHSRRSSFNSTSAMRRSASPAPSLPLPAVMPMEPSPKPSMSIGSKNGMLYANETLTSFFRRLTFTPDGSLLLTPAGQYQTQQTGPNDKTIYEIVNTVYIYTRGGINKAPIAHLPGHKKPSVAIRCSPVLYTIRAESAPTKNITIDTSSPDDAIPPLGEPVVSPKSTSYDMDPPPSTTPLGDTIGSSSKKTEAEEISESSGPAPTFTLKYRMVYAVATQDSVLLYDTQQQTPLCVVSNLHCATFTDLSWSKDGQTLMMTSSDGFCSTLTFDAEELGQAYVPDSSAQPKQSPAALVLSSQTTPVPAPMTGIAPPSPFYLSSHHRSLSNSQSSDLAQTASGATTSFAVRPSSPTRSNSTSSVATQSSIVQHRDPSTVISNPTLLSASMPSITAANFVTSGLSLTTPPETPRSTASSVVGAKRDASESERDDTRGQPKKRRIAPTPVTTAAGNSSKP